MFRKIFSVVSATILYLPQAQAQSASGGDFMRSVGSIWVVVGVILIALIGLFTILITLSRRLTKIENQFKSKNNVR